MQPRPFTGTKRKIDAEQFTARIPKVLSKKLRADAKRHNHSVNFTLTAILEAHYAK